MTSAELLLAVRIRFDDTMSPYLVSDATILQEASLAQTEFARNTLALYEISSGAITAADQWLTLPTDMYILKTVILNGLQLRPITVSELDYGYFTLTTSENSSRFSGWRATTGTPKFVVTDMQPSKVRLVPIPILTETASIEGYVLPPNLSVTSSPAVNPEIPDVYHELLIIGTLFRLNSQTDIDTANENKSKFFGTLWYQGITEAQVNLRTSLRRQTRIMKLPRGYVFDAGATKQLDPNEQQQSLM
jgi:hypothetical protein